MFIIFSQVSFFAFLYTERYDHSTIGKKLLSKIHMINCAVIVSNYRREIFQQFKAPKLKNKYRNIIRD